MQSFKPIVLLILLGAACAYSQQNCDPSCFPLSSVPVLRKEVGWFVGEYSLYGPDGDAFTSDTFPYRYAQYRGFRRTKLEGACRISRSVFVYPPLAKADCKSPDDVAGEGRCGTNGNEKIFGDERLAADCDGNLVNIGTISNFFSGRTYVTLGNDDTLLFQARYMGDSGGLLFQNELTTFGLNGTVLRTTQAFNRGEVAKPRLLSYFREQKVSKREWMRQLAETRANFNILKSDLCGWSALNTRSNTTCIEHFTLRKCPVKPRNRRTCEKQLQKYRRARRNISERMWDEQ